MLLSLEQVNKACNLTKEEVAAAMEKSGYLDTNFSAVEFLGMGAQGQFVYKVYFNDGCCEDEADEYGKVYLKYVRLAFNATFHLQGEY